MTTHKKYDYRLIQGEADWRAEIVRRKTAKEVVVSKKQDGFASESDAEEWAKTELQTFLKTQAERNKRRSKPRS